MFKYQEFIPCIKSSLHWNRYVKFIESRSLRSIPEGEFIERHHIVPQCYLPTKEIKKDRENIIPLTLREHFIAHLILWKAIGDKMALAFFMFIHPRDMELALTSREYKRLKEEFNSASRKDSLKDRRAVHDLESDSYFYVKIEDLDKYSDSSKYEFKAKGKITNYRFAYNTITGRRVALPYDLWLELIKEESWEAGMGASSNKAVTEGKKVVHDLETDKYFYVPEEELEDFIEKNPERYKAEGFPSKNKGIPLSEEAKQKIREKRALQTHLRTGVLQPEEMKERMSKRLLKQFEETPNYNFGHWWIHKVNEDGSIIRKQILAGTEIPEGFIRGLGSYERSKSTGKKPKRITIHRITSEGETELRRISVEESIPDGWIKGLPAKTKGFRYNINKGVVEDAIFNQPKLPEGWYYTYEEAFRNKEN